MRKAITSIKIKGATQSTTDDGFLRFQVEEWFENSPGFLSGPLPVEPIAGDFEAKNFSNGEFDLVPLS